MKPKNKLRKEAKIIKIFIVLSTIFANMPFCISQNNTNRPYNLVDNSGFERYQQEDVTFPCAINNIESWKIYIAEDECHYPSSVSLNTTGEDCEFGDIATISKDNSPGINDELCSGAGSNGGVIEGERSALLAVDYENCGGLFSSIEKYNVGMFTFLRDKINPSSTYLFRLTLRPFRTSTTLSNGDIVDDENYISADLMTPNKFCDNFAELSENNSSIQDCGETITWSWTVTPNSDCQDRSGKDLPPQLIINVRKGGFIIDEVELIEGCYQEDIYVQNKTFGELYNSDNMSFPPYEILNKGEVHIGRNADLTGIVPSAGDVNVESGARVLIESEERIVLQDGFRVKPNSGVGNTKFVARINDCNSAVFSGSFKSQENDDVRQASRKSLSSENDFNSIQNGFKIFKKRKTSSLWKFDIQYLNEIDESNKADDSRVRFVVHDMKGRIIKEKYHNVLKDIPLSLDSRSKGIYILKIHHNNFVRTKKLFNY